MRAAAEHLRVGRRELTSMAAILVAAHAFLDYPAAASRTALESAWMEPIFAGLLGLAVFFVVDGIFRHFFPGKDLLEVLEVAFGRAIGGVFAIGFAIYFLWITAGIMRQFAETVIITVLPTTPLIIVIALFAITVGYVAACGLEAIVRLAQLAFPVFVLGIVSVVLLTFNWWHPELLFPFWGNGFGSVLQGSLQSVSDFLNVLLLCIIYPHAKDFRDLRRVGVSSTIWGMVLLAIFIVGYHMVFAPEGATKLVSPLYSMARLIHIGRFLQRVESVYIFTWVSAAVIQMAITLWAASYILASSFNWPTYRPIIPALGLACVVAGMVQSDIASILRDQRLGLMAWGWIVVVAAPLLVMCIGAVRMRWRRPKNA